MYKNNLVNEALKNKKGLISSMAKTLNTKRKLCKVLTNGPLPELRGITGPIVYPCRIDMRKVINMVQHGKVVIEVNPKNQKEEVRLNIQNVNKDNFPEPERIELDTPPVKTPTPVVKKDEVVKAVQTNLVEEKKTSELDKALDRIIINDVGSTTASDTDAESKTVAVESEEKKKDWYKGKNKQNDFTKK